MDYSRCCPRQFLWRCWPGCSPHFCRLVRSLRFPGHRLFGPWQLTSSLQPTSRPILCQPLLMNWKPIKHLEAIQPEVAGGTDQRLRKVPAAAQMPKTLLEKRRPALALTARLGVQEVIGKADWIKIKLPGAEPTVRRRVLDRKAKGSQVPMAVRGAQRDKLKAPAPTDRHPVLGLKVAVRQEPVAAPAPVKGRVLERTGRRTHRARAGARSQVAEAPGPVMARVRGAKIRSRAPDRATVRSGRVTALSRAMPVVPGPMADRARGTEVLPKGPVRTAPRSSATAVGPVLVDHRVKGRAARLGAKGRATQPGRMVTAERVWPKVARLAKVAMVLRRMTDKLPKADRQGTVDRAGAKTSLRAPGACRRIPGREEAGTRVVTVQPVPVAPSEQAVPPMPRHGRAAKRLKVMTAHRTVPDRTPRVL